MERSTTPVKLSYQSELAKSRIASPWEAATSLELNEQGLKTLLPEDTDEVAKRVETPSSESTVTQDGDSPRATKAAEAKLLGPIPNPRFGASRCNTASAGSGWSTARENIDGILLSARREDGSRTAPASSLHRNHRQRLDTGCAKRPPRAQTDLEMDRLVALMRAEWPQIVRMAPSLKSGTGVVEEALMRKLHAAVGRLNLLCVRCPEAADRMIDKAKRLDRGVQQMMMKMFDSLDYPLLSDFLRTSTTSSSRLAPLKTKKMQEKRGFSLLGAKNGFSENGSTPQSPNVDAKPPLGPREVFVFTRPRVKSDWKLIKPLRLGYLNEEGKGWASSGLSAQVRAGPRSSKEPQCQIRHQLLSGWSTGLAVPSTLFIDPVRGHCHTPVHRPYDSDDDEAVREQILNMKRLKDKLEESRKEDLEKQHKRREKLLETLKTPEEFDDVGSSVLGTTLDDLDSRLSSPFS
uniref:Uncharacterized protein n=1 Tax=Tetraselmis sp. GSL018 TaxID=582737 RepID=A0A061RC00_9CHLO